jgi:hypothetical protein
MTDHSQWRRRRLSLLAAGAIAAGLLLLFGVALNAAPAVANDTSSGPVVAVTDTVQPDGLVSAPDGGADDQCTRDVCKRINWCDERGDSIKDDAPTIVVPLGGKTPECVNRPTVQKVTCCEGGVGNTTVWVTPNCNCHKMLIAVSIDSGAPIVKWVGGGETAKFTFSHVANGDHTVRASALVKKGVWCNFAKLHFKVKCASPSASHSHSASPYPSVSVSASPSHTHSASPSSSKSPTAVVSSSGNTGGSLPVTGPPAGLIAGVGLLMVLGGIALLLWRRRTRLVIE